MVEVFASSNSQNIVLLNKDPNNTYSVNIQMSSLICSSSTPCNIQVWTKDQNVGIYDPPVQMSNLRLTAPFFTYQLLPYAVTTFVINPINVTSSTTSSSFSTSTSSSSSTTSGSSNCGTGTAFFDSMSSFNAALWTQSNGYGNGSPFNTFWRNDHIEYNSTGMFLRLDNIPCSSGGCGTSSYASGQLSTVVTNYQYGHFECKMVPACLPGTQVSCFTYVGSPVHEEIHIDFFGSEGSCNQLHVSYAANGNTYSSM